MTGEIMVKLLGFYKPDLDYLVFASRGEKLSIMRDINRENWSRVTSGLFGILMSKDLSLIAKPLSEYQQTIILSACINVF